MFYSSRVHGNTNPGKTSALTLLLSLIFLCLTGFILPLSANNEREVIITFQAEAEASFYQIEWLTIPSPTWENPDKGSGVAEVIFESPIKKNLPRDYRYFRIRSALQPGLYGQWSQVYEIKSNMTREIAPREKVKTWLNQFITDGEPPSTRYFLKGNTLEIFGDSESDAIRYRLNKQKEVDYTEPLKFEKNGYYEIESNITDSNGRVNRRKIGFYVDTVKPVGLALIYPPFYYYIDQLVLGEQSTIQFKATDNPPGQAAAFYAVYKKGQPVNFKPYTKPLIAKDLVENSEEGVWLVYYAEDLVGNQSPVKAIGFLIDRKAPRVQLSGNSKSVSFEIEELSIPVKMRVRSADGSLLESRTVKNKDSITLPVNAEIIDFTDHLNNTVTFKKSGENWSN